MFAFVCTLSTTLKCITERKLKCNYCNSIFLVLGASKCSQSTNSTRLIQVPLPELEGAVMYVTMAAQTRLGKESRRYLVQKVENHAGINALLDVQATNTSFCCKGTSTLFTAAVASDEIWRPPKIGWR